MTAKQIRPFSDFLREQSKGRSHNELGEGLVDLVARVQDTGKKGSMTYIVTVEPTKGTDALTISDEIRLKLPEFARPASLFYADDDNNLRRDDPQQIPFDTLKEVPPGVDPGTGEVRRDYKGA